MNMLDAEGWLTGPRRVPSPNCDERPAGQLIRLIVVHAISLPLSLIHISEPTRPY